MKRIAGIAAIAGVGIRQYRRGQSPLPERGVLVRAIIDACEDAGFDPASIDGFASYGDDANEPVRLMSDLGIRELTWSSQVFGGGGGGIAGAFGQAVGAIATGQAKAVIVFRALVQRESGRLSAAIMANHLNGYMLGAGLITPAQACAIRAQRMLEHHKVPVSAVEGFVAAAYYHAARNQDAIGFGQSFDPEVYRGARWISEPFRLHDCSRENDGAGALLVVSAEASRDMRKPPVHILGVAQGAASGWGDLIENDADDQYSSGGFRSVARQLWKQTGLSPAEIDVAQIYENFSVQGVASLIDHGFCTYETVGDFCTLENLTAPSGRLPVNTAGGNLAQGFIHGIGIPIEAVRQLRGESANPVPGAQTCLFAGGPGAPIVSSAIFGTEATVN